MRYRAPAALPGSGRRRFLRLLVPGTGPAGLAPRLAGQLARTAGTVAAVAAIALGGGALLLAPLPLGAQEPEEELPISTDRPDFTEGTATVPAGAVALSWSLSPRLSAGANLGWALLEDDATGDRFGQGRASVSVGLAVGEETSLSGEAYGFTAEAADGPETGYLDAGLLHLLRPDLQLDLRAGAGLNDPEPEYFLGAGFSWRL